MKKFCPDCGSEQPINEFAFKNKAKGTRQAYCNEHRRERDKMKYKRLKGSIVASVRRRQSKYRQAIDSWKATLHCVFCTENNPVCLDFHHHQSNKEVAVSTLKSSGLKRMMKEVRKCVVVCRNCHAKIHNGDIKVERKHVLESTKMYNAPTGGTGAESTKLGSC